MKKVISYLILCLILIFQTYSKEYILTKIGNNTWLVNGQEYYGAPCNNTEEYIYGSFIKELSNHGKIIGIVEEDSLNLNETRVLLVLQRLYKNKNLYLIQSESIEEDFIYERLVFVSFDDIGCSVETHVIKMTNNNDDSNS